MGFSDVGKTSGLYRAELLSEVNIHMGWVLPTSISKAMEVPYAEHSYRSYQLRIRYVFAVGAWSAYRTKTAKRSRVSDKTGIVEQEWTTVCVCVCEGFYLRELHFIFQLLFVGVWNLSLSFLTQHHVPLGCKFCNLLPSFCSKHISTGLHNIARIAPGK